MNKTYIGPQADADDGPMEKNYIGPQADADVGPISLPPTDKTYIGPQADADVGLITLPLSGRCRCAGWVGGSGPFEAILEWCNTPTA